MTVEEPKEQGSVAGNQANFAKLLLRELAIFSRELALSDPQAIRKIAAFHTLMDHVMPVSHGSPPTRRACDSRPHTLRFMQSSNVGAKGPEQELQRPDQLIQMKITNSITTGLLLGCLLVTTTVARADLVHRYSFNESAGTTTVKDSSGTADGVIKGEGAFYDGTGQLHLPGQTTSAADPPAGFVDLPNHIINVLTNLTIETWVTWEGSGEWQRIFDFGTSAGGEDVVDGNGGYLFLSPMGNVNIRFALRDPVAQAENVQATALAPLDTYVEVCLTVTYDYDANVSRVFSNGVQIATSVASTKLSTVNDVNNWLGRSQWNDAMFQGSYNEFRIYDYAMNPLQVAASYVSGVTTPSTDPAALGELQTLHLNAPRSELLEGDKQESAPTADFAKASSVTLAGTPGVAYTSDNPTVVKVDVDGTMEALSAGVAQVSVAYLGKTNSVTITVSRRQAGLANAGTLYVDLRPSGLTSDGLTWTNRAGEENFMAEGTPGYVANVENTGLPGVRFNGTESFLGPITTSDLDASSDRSIEVWAYDPVIAAEETLVSWGHRGGPNRSNMSLNYGANADYGAAGQWGEDVGWKGAPVAGVWHYLVYTYGGTNDNKARVYADGVLKNTREFSAPLDTFAGFPIRIGAQANTDGTGTDFAQSLTGYIGLVRVHGGALSANDIKNNFLYGMELTEPGTLTNVTLSVPATIVGLRSRAQATVFANYTNRSYLFVNGQTTFESSNPDVATVDTNGIVTAVALGTAEISANYQGKKASQTVQVVANLPAKLVHRYSFGETVGSTTVKDSAGTADGVVKGEGAAFDGAGKLTVPGGPSSAADPPAGYVDLPNGIISVLTNVSFEAWITWDGPAVGGWQRIFDFGTSAGGEDIVDGNGGYLFLSPAGNANLRFAVRDPILGSEPVVDTAGAPLPIGVEVYVAVSYNYDANESRVYSNAVSVASGPASVALRTINDVNNWLARSQWADGMFAGTFNEFRIWDGALTPENVAASLAAGPDTLPSVTPKPSLKALVQGQNLVLSWPGDAAGYAPESSASLGPQAVWSAVPGTPTLADGKYTLNVVITTTNQFIRLKK